MFKPDQNLIQQIEEWIESNQESFIKDLDRLVSIPSVSENGDAIYPFGKNCADVLDEAIVIGKEYGFPIDNHEYYCGSCLVRGTSADARRIGMFAHLDIVPLGEGWQHPPLRCTEKDGFLIGRGVGDNKGPGVCALYALRFLREHGIKLKNDVLLYLGLSEETGMQDIEYFCKTQQVPDFALVTDTNFPVCFGEKGLFRAEAAKRIEGNLVSFQAGSVVNVIPAKAEAVVSQRSLEQVKKSIGRNDRISVAADGDHVKITASGLSKHAAFPEGSVNAVNVLAEALGKSGILDETAAETIANIAKMTADYYGAGVGISCEDHESGKLTCVGSVVCMDQGKITLTFDIRYPVTADGKKIERAFQEHVQALAFMPKTTEISAPAYFSPDDSYIPLLCDICDYVQGKHYEPYTMGGGTYSRHLPNAIGFGPGIPDAPNPFEAGHGQGHQPDESIPLEVLLNGLKTYIITLIELDKIL